MHGFHSRRDLEEKSRLTFREGLLATGGLRKKLLALGDGLAAEANTLLRIEDGTLPDETLDATGTTVDLVQGHLVDDLGAMLPVLESRCQPKSCAHDTLR